MEKLIKKINAYTKAYHVACSVNDTNSTNDTITRISNKLIRYEQELYNKNQQSIYKMFELLKHYSRVPIGRQPYNKQLPHPALPVGTFIDSTNYFNVDKQLLTYKKPAEKKRYITIVTFKDRLRSNLGTEQRRTKVEATDYANITVLKRKHKRTPLINLTKKDNYLYRGSHYLDSTNRYLSDISIAYLNHDKIKSRCTCNRCKCINTLKTYYNSLACSKCGHYTLTVKHYKIRHYYISPLIRFTVNELTQTVAKEVETSRGFKTIYKGKI
jgi:hypothetical protein